MPTVIGPVVVTSALRFNSAIFDKRPPVAMECLLGTLYQMAPRLLIPSSRAEEPTAPNGEDENEAAPPRSRGHLATACQLCWHEASIERSVARPRLAAR